VSACDGVIQALSIQVTVIKFITQLHFFSAVCTISLKVFIADTLVGTTVIIVFTAGITVTVINYITTFSFTCVTITSESWVTFTIVLNASSTRLALSITITVVGYITCNKVTPISISLITILTSTGISKVIGVIFTHSM